MRVLVIEKDLSRHIRDVPEPEIKAYEAKCKILACGLCGSDKKFLSGVPFAKAPPISYPLVLGHESVGEVVEVGAHVRKFKVGDIVSGPLLRFAAGYDMAWGGFSEYGTVLDEGAAGYAGEKADLIRYLAQRHTVLPDWLAPKQGPMLGVMRETLGAIRHFGMDAGQSIVVYGLGPIGMAFVRFLSIKGLAPIIAIDIVDEKVKRAKDFGADYAFNANDPDLEKKILDICPKGVNHVLDGVGIPEAWDNMIPLLGENAQLAIFGVAAAKGGMVNWDLRKYWNFRLNFFQMTQPGDDNWAHNQVLALIKAGAINLDDYIAGYFPFDDILSVLDQFMNNAFQKKPIITF